MKKILFAIFFTISAMGLEVPEHSSPVVDLAGMFSSKVSKSLRRKIDEIYKTSGTQFAVLTIPSLEGEILEDFSIRVVDKWKLGKTDTDRGLLILLAKKERKVRVEVGQGLEGEITDVMSARAISKMTPYFKKGDFNGGLLIGVAYLYELAGVKFEEANYKKLKKSSRNKKLLLPILLIWFFIFMIPLFFRPLSRRMRGHYDYGDYGGDYSSWGGGSSGGFSGGDGGGFSGGGSSGDW